MAQFIYTYIYIIPRTFVTENLIQIQIKSYIDICYRTYFSNRSSETNILHCECLYFFPLLGMIKCYFKETFILKNFSS